MSESVIEHKKTAFVEKLQREFGADVNTARHDPNQALVLEPRQRMAHRGPADAQIRRQLLLV